MKKVVITGSDGFVGRNLVRAWHNKYDLITIDLPPSLFDLKSHEYNPKIKTQHLSLDLRDEQYVLADYFSGVDTVIHLAARTRINPSWHDYKDYYDTNVSATQELYTLARTKRVKRFVYFSSSSVYGNSSGASKETDRLHPTNPYAISKASAEMALQAEALRGGPDLIIVRPFTMYGDFMAFGDNALAIARFIDNSSKDIPLQLDAGGFQERDYTHVNDTIQALDLIMEKAQHGDIFNVGTGRSISIKSIADVISSLQVITPARTGHIDKTLADISRLEALGYRPKEDFFTWLQNFLDQYKLKKNF